MLSPQDPKKKLLATETPGPAKTPAERIALKLLQSIARGEFHPGDRLPTQAVLRKEMAPRLSMTFFNEGLQILKKKGFLDIKQRCRTSVADPLPNRNAFALVLPREIEHAAGTSLFCVMAQMASRIEQRHPEYRVSRFYAQPAASGNGHSIEDLKMAVRWHRVAGVIFTHQFFHHENLYTEPGVARVFNGEDSLMRRDWMLTAPHFTLPDPTGRTFVRRALERLRTQGCRTVAVIRPMLGIPATAHNFEEPDWHPTVSCIQEVGLKTRPEWLLNVAGSGWEIGRLLMSGKTLPDAVLISDDGLIPDVTAGIASMPKPWPSVVGVVNFPALPEAHVPVLFGGFNIEALFEWCFRALCDPEMQRACTPYPAEVLFEDEWRAQRGRPMRTA